MKLGLFQALLEKHAIGRDNIITATYSITDFFGHSFNRSAEFRIENILQDSNKIIFDLISITENKPLKVTPEAIVYIDGMEPCRYADIYDLLPDGTSKKVGKKRGRKPKNHMAF